MVHSLKKSWLDFFNLERKRLIGYVRSLIQDTPVFDGEDIVQDVITGILDKADIATHIENFSAYVYQSLRNRVVDYMRRKREHEHIDAELPGDTGLLLSDILSDLKFDTASEIEKNEISRDLSTAIDMLDEKYQSVFVATEMECLTFQELSEKWDIPIGTLLARKSRSMKMLRDSLIKLNPEFYSRLQQKG